MELDIAIRIFALIALVSFIVLAIIASVFFGKTTRELSKLNEDLSKMSKELVSSFKNIDESVAEAKVALTRSLENFDQTSAEFKTSLAEIRSKSKSFLNSLDSMGKLIDGTRQKISPPVNEAASYLSATAKAVSTFLAVAGKFKKKGEKA